MTVVVPRRPQGWQPPFPAWSGKFDGLATPAIFGYIGCQSKTDGGREGEQVAAFRQWWQRASEYPDGPVHVEAASYFDAEGRLHRVVLAYWLDADRYDRWWAQSVVSDWWLDPVREQETVGYWREINVVAPDRFETVFSSRNPTGIAAASDGFTDEIVDHAYWGAMRARIPASASDPLTGSIETLRRPHLDPATASSRVRLQLADNLAMIRSGQDWRACGADERAYYLDHVHGTLVRGMDYLRDNPEDSGCLSCRLMTSEDPATNRQVTFGTAVFRDLTALEQWAEFHPTHVTIFGTFLQMVKVFAGKLDLRLWHEVVIIDGPSSTYEYINCSEDTGVQRWLGRI